MRCFLALVVGGLAGCADSGTLRPLRVGDPAPAYSAVTLAGDTLALTRFQGQAVLLNVWATWCIPCREEMPAIQRLGDRFADSGLRVLGVNIDPGTDEGVHRFLEEHGIGFTIVRDPGNRVGRVFKTIGVPETFLLDRRGRVAARWIGQFEADGDAVREAVRAALR